MNFDNRYYSVKIKYDFDFNLIVLIHEYNDTTLLWDFYKRIKILNCDLPEDCFLPPYITKLDESYVVSGIQAKHIYDHYIKYQVSTKCKVCDGKRYIMLFTTWTGCPACNIRDTGSYTYFEIEEKINDK